MSAGKRKVVFDAVTPDAQAKRHTALKKGQRVQPVLIATRYGFEMQLHNLRFEDGMRVAKANIPQTGHWMKGTDAHLKGNQERDGFSHCRLANFSQGLVRMPIACKQIGLNAIKICDEIIWLELDFAPCEL